MYVLYVLHQAWRDRYITKGKFLQFIQIVGELFVEQISEVQWEHA